MKKTDIEKNKRLSELKTGLILCSYSVAIIEKTFFNAKLEGPAPKKEEIVIPFVLNIIVVLIREGCSCWLSPNNSETVKTVTLAFTIIQ